MKKINKFLFCAYICAWSEAQCMEIENREDSFIPSITINKNISTGVVYSLYSESSNCYLDGRDKAGDFAGISNLSLDNKYSHWLFIPNLYKIEAVITDFQYDSPPQSVFEKYKKKVSLIETRTIKNNGPAELTDTVSYSKTLTNTLSYGFKESLSFTYKTSVKAGIPGIGEGTTEWSFTGGFESNQQVTNTDTITYNQTKQVKVPPFTSVRISAYTNWVENIEMPFTATVKMTSLASRLTKKYKLVNDKIVSGDVLYQYLTHNKFEGVINKIEENAVFAKITGIFTGSYGLDSVFSADQI